MPDADKFGKLSRRWSRMAKKVYEGHFDSASLADDAMNPLRKDIENYGPAVLSFLKEASFQLKDLQRNPLFLRNHDWNEEDRFIHNLASSYNWRYRPNIQGMNIAISAYKSLVCSFRNGEFIVKDLHEALLHYFVREIYDSNFAAKVILFAENNPDMDLNAINQKLNEMSIFIDDNINAIVSQIVRKGRMGRARRIHSVPPKAISINDDVLSLGSNK